MNKIIKALKDAGITADDMPATYENLLEMLTPVCPYYKNQPCLVSHSDKFYNRYAAGKVNEEGKSLFFAEGKTSLAGNDTSIWNNHKPNPKAPSIINWIANTGVKPEFTKDDRDRVIILLKGCQSIHRAKEITSWSLDYGSPVEWYAIISPPEFVGGDESPKDKGDE